ncbi:u1 small nuclear ribonucleoprotein c [Phtheirospermum japonicum]|uniref:U1 small nuclear ribonucleoprotein C n=1 Tax=Phtheirospermum japonicum TaxID=374723 RepID=A0A830CDT2_9LAMI|nr:u1 small nuclear ribonucleoprotein c [Phtheirospermum japonicum]
MPRYYCDYCDTYLTHDSPSVRKQHNSGYKHKANIREYYQKFEQQQTQFLIDQKIKEHLGQTVAYQQIGAAYNQHLAIFPEMRPRLPVMPPHMLHLPHQMAQGIRPPLMPIPIPGYAAAPGVLMQPPPTASLPLQPSGLPGPPSTSAPPSVPGGDPPPATQMFNVNNPNGTAATAGGGYSYPQASQMSH